MKVKWNNQILNIENQADNPNKDFFCVWNDYTIEITLDDWYKKCYKKKLYNVTCSTPVGGYIVEGTCKTIREGLQECFDNIDYPLKTMEDYENEEDD